MHFHLCCRHNLLNDLRIIFFVISKKKSSHGFLTKKNKISPFTGDGDGFLCGGDDFDRFRGGGDTDFEECL